MDLRRPTLDVLRFRQACLQDSSPSGLARAATRAVGADGGTLCLTDLLVRLPIGVTGREAWVAEGVQASVGSGPSETALGGQAVMADEDELVARWPIYHDSLRAWTTYRATLSFPLTRPNGSTFAVLDVYTSRPRWTLPETLSLVQAEVANFLAVILLHETSSPHGTARVEQLCVGRREQVWVAVGMLREGARLGERDAIAVLRAYAFTHGSPLDDVADQLVNGGLAVEQLLDPPPEVGASRRAA